MTVPRSLSPRGLLCGVLFGLLLWVLIALAFVARTQAEGQRQEYSRITFYLPTGSPMRDGTYPYVGAAACGSLFAYGTVLELPDGWQVVCRDTGYLQPAQVDIFSPTRAWGLANVEAAYGAFAWVTVVVP